jgi:hypothetical protein
MELVSWLLPQINSRWLVVVVVAVAVAVAVAAVSQGVRDGWGMLLAWKR